MFHQTYLHLLILITLSRLSCAQNETKITVSCTEHQEAFGDSCYEFVDLRRTFFSAQAWCEQRGGHLGFIQDEETHYFLQRHLDPTKDMWLGAASCTDLHYSAAVEGPPCWLDGSRMTYSSWVRSPQPGAACAHILRDSGLQWEATRDCNKTLPFICQFESGRSIVCPARSTTLRCGSGRVLMIDGAFYGRKSIHYCRPTPSPPTTPTHFECSWVDVVDSLRARCGGRQLCRITAVVDSFGEPCPQLGSYLSLDYHCEDGLRLSVNAAAAVSDDVSLTVKWLLGDISCKLSTGDGRVIYLHSAEGSESSAVHKYIHAGTFIVAVECTSGDMHITTQRAITIQEPIREFGVITCHAGKLSFHSANCKALHGEQFQIQMEVKAGTNVTYRIQSDETLLAGLSVVRGDVPQKVTVAPEMVEQLGPGCHQLTLYASNMVTSHQVSADLQVCVLEKVSGLQASVLTERDDCLDSPQIVVGVSLEHGAPVLLRFAVSAENSSFSEARGMNSSKDIFHIRRQIQGSVRMKVTDWNVFSSSEVDVDLFASCGEDSVVTSRKKHVRVARSLLKIIATPAASVSNKSQDITLSTNKASTLTDSLKRYQWSCTNPCQCQGNFEGLTHTIQGSCLPYPFNFNKYYFEVINKLNNDVEITESICITLTPVETQGTESLTCIEGCEPITENTDARMKLDCPGQLCPNHVWYVEDLRKEDQWPQETKSCYQDAGKRPLERKQDGGAEYTVSYSTLSNAKSEGQDVTVVLIFGDSTPFYKSYTIKTSASTGITTQSTVTNVTTASNPGPAITQPGAITAATTTTADTSSYQSSSTSPTTTADSSSYQSSSTSATTTADTSSPATTSSSDSDLQCSVSPQSGTILDVFKITCNTKIPCSDCRYCFKTQEGKHLRCSMDNEVKSVFLPLGDSSSNYNLIITATAKNRKTVAETTITAQVLDSTADSGSSVEGLKGTVEEAVDQLKKENLLTGVNVGQIFSSVSNKLNQQSDESKKEERQKLREQMLDVMITTVKNVPTTTPDEVQVIARGVNAIIQKGSELSPAALAGASLFFANLSSSLLHMEVNNSEEVHSAASTIVEGAGNILHYSSNKNISDALLLTLGNTQSALLTFKNANEGPTVIQQDHISVFVNRVTPESLHTESINIPNCSCPMFSLPVLPSNMFPSEEPVDVRMLTLDENPFSWNDRGNISGQIGSLSLTTTNGSNINVENLSEDIEILLPSPLGEQVRTTFLDLGNYSTTAINISSADSTLVLKMVPSADPLPFKLFLGYMDYPTDTNNIAMTEMPQQGTTQEERYTWILEPKDLKGNTGLHYLVVRPIVGPGVKSINANLSITPITTACKFWDESILDWSDYGCRVGVQTTHLVTQCLCNHLTFFGSSFFVTPNLVDPSRTAELFGTFAENPVVVCFVGALFVAYLLVVVWARRKDIQDTAKVKVTVLQDNDPMDEYHYLLSVSTGHRRGASTSSQVTITLLGTDGSSEPHHLTDPKKRVFERGGVDLFVLTAPFSLGDLQAIRLWHNNSGSHPDWYVGNVVVQDLQTEQKWHFLCNSWLAIDIGDCSLNKVFPVSTEMDLKRFSNLFFMKTSKDFSDGHLWYSVISRPPSSTFTCVQRVSCCFSLLLCTMLTSIMFYGIPTDPSEQTMDLGHFEFTWQQFMIGVQSSLIMFPVNILIVSIFRNTRPREAPCCRRKTAKAEAPELASVSQTADKLDVTLETVIKDITRIANSLSKTTKSNIPCTDPGFGPGKQLDINAVLSVVEDFIKQSNKTCDTTQSKTPSIHNLGQPQTPESSAGMHPGSTAEGIQKKSNKTQFLYQQLCHIDKELSLLGPSGFPSPHSYSQALQQVQGMKGLLEDQLFKFSSNADELAQKKYWSHTVERAHWLGSTDSPGDGDGSPKKSTCCHGGLPWWFIFFGWFLVIATSVVAGYFTMLYGLKFGKERSISWLISMIVSFFQSILVIQPLKVLCLAVFFALVIKKVDEEDYQNVAFVGNDRNQGDQRMIRQDNSLYEPPPPGDIEKMRRNKILEQKAFALLREIFIYVGFMWMLLLVAYGQKDPNAFFLNQHIRDSFGGEISDSMGPGDVFAWANTSLLSNLFGVYPGFITDGNSKLVGNARLRQLRVQKKSCRIAGSMLQLIPDCHAPYSWEAEDMGSYDPGWNRSVEDNVSTSASSPWRYQTQAQLRAYPVWGMVLYRGGGFAAELGPDLENASSTLEYLFRNKWLDMYTRAIFVEFTVYNANVNLFCIVTLLFETTAVGAFQFNCDLQSIRLYHSPGGLHIFVMAAEIIYLLFILYYMFVQGKLMKQQRWAYFKSKWNLLELTIILLSWSAVAVFTKRTLLGNRDMTYYQNHKDHFPSFHETATADSTLQYLVAFLVLLATVKLWHLLRLNPKMNLITAALQRAWSDISSFLVIIVIVLVAYSIVSNVIYGWKMSSYRTLLNALMTVILLQIGIFNYDEVLDCTPLLGGLLFGSCIMFMTFVLLNLFISVILVAFNQEQIYHKPSDEEEIVDLMLKKLCSLFGIRYKTTKDTHGPDVKEGSGLTLNNSRNIHEKSDVSIFQTSEKSVNP